MKLGLIGEKLPHSYSKVIFEELLGYSRYDLIELSREELAALFENFDYDGLNVTVPYKTEVMQYLDEIDDIAREIGAVNTVVKRRGKIFGTNTDYDGLRLDSPAYCVNGKIADPSLRNMHIMAGVE